ncbi:MAG: hypothetical protein HBSAPP03_26670 [Phycisphaerae bacterium]|nr:MAG: hypothetical protein HBSAPP03_26670 [Phycisphaerae bacterium]
MDTMHWVLLLSAVGAVGGVVWLLVQRGTLAARVAVAEGEARTERERRAQAEAVVAKQGEELKAAGAALASAGAAVARLEASLESERAERENERLTGAKFEERLKTSFGALAGEALAKSNAEFLNLAEQRLKTEREKTTGEVKQDKAAIEAMLEPIRESLKKTDEKLGTVQQQWASDRGALTEQLKGIGTAGESLRAETGKLVKALSRPEVRGAWGEFTLRRVAELSGMSHHCTFEEQRTARDGSGTTIRPDMIVRLPNDRCIAIDAKTNTDAYLAAANATTDAERLEHMNRFVRHLDEQVASLSGKRYWDGFEGSLDLVVMFVPGEPFLDAAVRHSPDILEKAAAKNVLIVSPVSLIGLLRAVAVGWREKRLDEQANELLALGRELHERAAIAFEKVSSLGKAIDAASSRYNDFVASYESRLEPTLRKFEDAGIKSGKALPAMVHVESRVRALPAATPRQGDPA